MILRLMLRQYDCVQKSQAYAISFDSFKNAMEKDRFAHVDGVNIEPTDFMYRVLCTVCRVVFERMLCYDISFVRLMDFYCLSLS